MYVCLLPHKKQTRFVVAAGAAEETLNEFDAEAIGN